MSDKVDGRIEQWVLGFENGKECIIWGFLYDDGKMRFSNGTWFHTSGTPIHDFKEGDLIRTRNSIYLLGKPMDIGRYMKRVDFGRSDDGANDWRREVQ